jgi:type VI secretion system lysozyme-like protein
MSDLLTIFTTDICDKNPNKNDVKKYYLNSIIENLSMLLNTRNNQHYKTNSTLLDYGLIDFSKLNQYSAQDKTLLAEIIENLIRNNESRLYSIKVKPVETDHTSEINIHFSIEAKTNFDEKTLLLYYQIDPINLGSKIEEIL